MSTPTASLDAQARHAMCELYLSCYEATSPQIFESDLLGKDEALLLYFGPRLVGFTTLRLFDTRWRGDDIRVVFSGDTVVDPKHWGQQALSVNWVRRMGQIKRMQPDKRLVWFLLVKGHRTYRYLHVFAKVFHPKEGAHDADLSELADYLAQQQYGPDYNRESGLVEFSPSRGQLKPAVSEPREDEQSRTGVTYFLKRNPAFRIGHELVCVCDIEEANMKPMTLRLFRQGFNALAPGL
ncbi:hypothetical protein [Niveibacterium sp. COAC-50]|uniref:hypothetical protein n=1 Tax=Niveibacterium sp. COAC-50 TaxID=2729384 RepID=UPI00155634B3|nr:hypothetical protein [Niveibacterium sp. COAC-50]